MLTKENIENHFIVNPDWTPENYIPRAKEIFEKNGYRFEELRPFKGKTFGHVVELEIYKGKEWLWSLQYHQDTALEQLLVDCICNYEVDVSKFKNDINQLF